MIPGLVSITFRTRLPEQIAAVCAASGLQAVEWGGDVHVPHGDIAAAERVARLTHEHGLIVASYGSYFRLGARPGEGPEWAAVLDTAEALGAPVIRVWAGTVGSERMDAEARGRMADEARGIAASAGDRNLRVAFEYHGGVLTDAPEPAWELFEAAGSDVLAINWQPQHHHVTAQGLEELRLFAPRLAHVHVFAWVGGWHDKRPLSVHADRWQLYLEAARRASPLRLPDGAEVPRCALLEFLPQETDRDLKRDAATLRGWLEGDSIDA